MSDQALFVENEIVPSEPDLFPQQEAMPQPNVPKNIEEVAAQVALASDKEGPLLPAIKENAARISSAGTGALYGEILYQEHKEKTESMRQLVNQYARERNAQAAKQAAEQLSRMEQTTPQPTDNPVETQQEVARRALSALSSKYAQSVFPTPGSYAAVLDKAADDVATRNIIANASAKLGEPSLWDQITYFLQSFIPYGPDFRANQVAGRVAGTSRAELSSYETLQKLRDTMLGMSLQERERIVDEFTKQDFGLAFGDNLAAKQDFLRKLMEMTREEANMDSLLNTLGVLDVAALVSGLTKMALKGRPIDNLKITAGDKKAGEVLADVLPTDPSVVGVNNAEAISAAIAAGRNPFVATDVAAGMAPHLHSKLKTDYDNMLKEVRERLNSSGRTEEERKAAEQAIMSRYMRDPNKRVHSVEFGEASDDGLSLLVRWTDHDGALYTSREAALNAIAREGLANARAVRLSDVALDGEIKASQVAYHGGTATDTLSPDFIGKGQGGGALGQGFYMSTAEDLARVYAEKYGHTLSAWSIPDDDKFINWYAKGSDQPEVVKKAVAKLLKGVDTADMEGRDIYAKLKETMGEQKAQEALSKAGVKGNFADTSGPHGRGPEHLLFSGKDAKLKYTERVENVPKNKVEEAPIEIDGEVFYSKATQSPQARSSVDSPAESLVRRGNISVSASIDKRYANLASDWLKDLRLNNEQWYIVTPNAVRPALDEMVSASPPLAREQLMRVVNNNLKANSQGMYVPLTKNGAMVHMIVLPEDVLGSFRRGVSTLAHEIGHGFDRSVLRRAPEQVRSALYQEFKKWWEKNTTGRDFISMREFETLYRVPTDDSYQLVAAARKNPSAMFDVGNYNLSWHGKFGEFWAENFAKFMLTDTKPVSVLEKWFGKQAALLKQFFQKVSDFLKKEIGTDATLPVVSIRDVMKDYLANPNKWDGLVDTKRLPKEDVGLSMSKKPGDAMSMRAALEKEIGKEMRRAVDQRASEEAKAAARARLETLRAEVAKLDKMPETPSAATPEEWVIEQVRTDPYSYDAIGKYSEKDIKSMAWVALDPKHGASEQAMEARVIGIHAEAKTRKALADYIAPYYSKLSKEEYRRVEALLEEGNSFSVAGSYGKEFTYLEARAKGLSEEGAQAYLATRSLRMAMYHIRNSEMVRHLRAQGYKEVVAPDGTRVVGKEYDLGSASGYVGKQVYDVSTGKATILSTEQMAEAYAAGQRIVNLAHPIKIDGELRTTFLGTHKDLVVRDIQQAIGYRPGEYSRIYTDEYFIKMKQRQIVDGVEKTVETTIRTAASAREANEYAANMKAAIALLRTGAPSDSQLNTLIGQYMKVDELRKAHADGLLNGIEDVYSHYTRNKDEYLNGSVQEAMANGRLFTSKRSDQLFSVDASRPNTMGVFESLEAEITNISRVANINEWRETNIRRWMNTFGHLIPHRTGDDVSDFYNATGASFTRGSEEALFAERTHRYIMRQIGVSTDEEKIYETLTRRFTEKWLTGNEGIERVGAKVRDQSFLGLMRSINFNLTLGMFNPAQLIVQANGAATAMILSPLHGLAAAKTFPLLRMALMSDNPDVWRKLANVDKALLGNPEDFISLVKAVRQTGIIDNIRSTSLYNKEEGKLNIFASYPTKALSGHTFFFNRGEEFSRLVSFDVARREWQAANKGVDWTSAEALRQIVVRMDDLTQNMTRANLARFQEGAASIPLQFAQYNIKLGMNILSSLLGKGEGRGFTKTEALGLMAGHIMLYGAAGNGLVGVLDEIIPEDARESLPVNVKQYLAQGLIAGLVNQIGEWFTGERMAVAVGSRLGSFDYYQRLAETLFTDPKNIHEVLFGPSLNTARRLGVVGDVAYLWYKDPQLTPKDVLEGLKHITTEQVATLRNSAKAYLFHQLGNKMVDSKGVPMAQLTSGEVFAQALGFQSTAAVDISTMIKSKRQHTEALTDIAATIFKVQKSIMAARASGDDEYADNQMKVLQALWPENLGDFYVVQRLVREKLYPYDTQFQKLIGEHLMKGSSREQPMVVTQPPRN